MFVLVFWEGRGESGEGVAGGRGEGGGSTSAATLNPKPSTLDPTP